MNLREQILGAQDIKTELVTVEQWGGITIEVNGLTGEERKQILEGVSKFVTDDNGNTVRVVDDAAMHVPLIIASARDPKSKQRIFTEADRDALWQKSGGALDTVASVVLRISGMSQAEAEKIKGNSQGTPSDDSTSA